MNLLRLGALALGAVWLAPGFASHAAAQERPIGRPFGGTAPKGPINTLKELHQAFYGCLKLPAREQSQPGMEITVRLSVTRTGDILGEPLFTFSTPEARSEIRANYQRAVADAFKLCVPFPLTPSLGEAVAGRPQSFRFIDTRGQRKA